MVKVNEYRRVRVQGHVATALQAAVVLVSVAVLAVAANDFALLPGLRAQVDATKSRAYSLSPQTKAMLADLQGQWTIALVLVEAGADVSMRRQVGEVLRQFAQAAPQINVVRIDPTDPRSLSEYERLLDRLQTIYLASTDRYEQALDGGMAELAAGVLFAQQQGPPLHAALARLNADDPRRKAVQQRINLVAVLADQGDEIRTQIRAARQQTREQPIPDYDAARSILAQTLTEFSTEMNDLAAHLDRWAEDGEMDAAVRQFASSSRGLYRDTAQRLAAAADPLRRLPDLELSGIGRRMREGELAMILGPQRAAVIPAAQLFPGMNLRRDDDGVVRFDQRFRGEQLISSAIRSLLVEQMPEIVFVHAGEASLRRTHARQVDVAGSTGMLTAAGYHVSEWQVGHAQRPTLESGRSAVWVIVPEAQRTQIEPDEQERKLIDAAAALIAEGEPVLLSVYPSLMPKYRQADPWHALTAPFGVQADTARVIVESVRVSEDERRLERGQALQQFPFDHPISRAVNGQQVYFGLPVAIHSMDQPSAGVEHAILAAVGPDDHRWQEEDWAVERDMEKNPGPAERFDAPAAVAIAAERPHPSGAGRQRFILIGSGGWMLSFIADVTVSLGDERVALANPGNHELMLASVAWLAGMDQLIAPSALSRQVERLDGITSGVRTFWFWITIAILPTACIGTGMLVWLRRRA